MRRAFFAWTAALASAIGCAIGCNAVLGNDPGVLSVDSGLFDAAPEEAATETISCEPGSKLCANTCLSTTDPTNGCSGSCSACASPTNGQPACNGPNGSCGLGSCDDGFADCDKNSSDGCEALLTSRTSCGSCDNDCAAQGRAFCSPSSAGGLQCSDTCSGTDCCGDQPCTNPNDPAGDCVDLSKNLQRCGSCGKACPNVANATISCNGGVCGYTCNPGYQDCGNGVCAVLSGASCGCGGQNCNALTNGMWTCGANGTCQCGNPTSCSRGSLTACCGGGICCGNGGSGTSTCTTENNNACGSTCAKCAGTSHCDTTMHQCVCTTGTVCAGAAGTTCCPAGDYCDAGTCESVVVPQCPSPTSCARGGDAGTGCCKTASSCQTANTSAQGCGSTCSDCGGSACCCADAGDPAGFACAPKITVDGGTAMCPPGCNP